MDTPAHINPLDKLLPLIATAVQEWQASNTPESIGISVKKLLDANSKKITMKLLGFDINYSQEWQLDHCNTRSGNSAAGDYLRESQSIAIKEWLATVMLPEVDKKMHKTISKQLQSEYEYRLNEKVRELVLAQVKKDAEELVNSIVVSNNAESFYKLTALINPEVTTK